MRLGATLATLTTLAFVASCQASNIFGVRSGTIGDTGGTQTITISPTTASISVGTTTTLTSNQTSVEWDSLDPTIASVSNGTVSGLSVGTATIRVRLLSDTTQQATATITVTQSVSGSPMP